MNAPQSPPKPLAFTVQLPLPPDALSPNARKHWRAKARATSAYRTTCAWSIRSAIPKGWDWTAPVVVDVEYRAHRGCDGYHPRDEDNARASLKAAMDALRDAGAIASDAKDRLRWGDFTLITTARELERRRQGVGITLTVRRREVS